MANDEEEIIIIEDADAAGNIPETKNAETGASSQAKKSKQNLFLLLGGVGIALLIFILSLTILLLHKSPQQTQTATNTQPIKQTEPENMQASQSQIEAMIAKANYLYNSNNKQEALHLYEQIATFNEALSQYNLGVAQLKGKQYKKALITFSHAIEKNEKVCVSAINAAVCSLHLHDLPSFHYYINLAYAALPNEVNSPLYSYYYAIIKYYKGDYFESLSALKHPSSDYYKEQKRYLKSKIDSLFGNYTDAAKAFGASTNTNYSFELGLLEANMGNYAAAIPHLQQAQMLDGHPVREKLALALVNLKAGNYQSAAKEIKEVTHDYPKKVYKTYPLKVFFKSGQFDPLPAQEYYRHILNNSLWIDYAILFHFAPYKIFNANNTIRYIRRGNANIYTNDIHSATNYLQRGRSLSSVNFQIAQAINKALVYKIREANEQLAKIAKLQPKHSILQYNLALTYAQLGDISNAYKHFTTSYYLDSKNYLAAIFSMLCAQILHKDNTQFNTIFQDNLSHEHSNLKNRKLYRALLDLANNNFIDGLNTLQNISRKKQPLDLALESLIAKKLNNQKNQSSVLKQLKNALPHDIVAQLLYINAKLQSKSPIQYARDSLFFMKKQNLNFDAMLYGSYLTRYLYTYESLFTGTLYPLQQKLQEKLEGRMSDSPKDIVYSLAFADLLSKRYEEAYILFNQIIDQYRIKDDNSFFYGALASIAADHHANAIALLELAILQNPYDAQSHYVLGLLYLEHKNNNGAALQFNQIVPHFHSAYFDFQIDTDKLDFALMQRQKS
jgi:predicted Zn-dependent protease